MKIVSKFRDYYDSAGVWYSDYPLYVREYVNIEEFDHQRNEIKEAYKEVRKILKAMPHYSKFDCRAVIAFCGKAYPCYILSGPKTVFSSQKVEQYHQENLKDYHCIGRWEHEDAIKVLNKKSKWYASGSTLTHQSWERFINEQNLKLSSTSFRAAKAPVFVLQEHYRDFYLEINPILRTHDFASQVDPFTAFQEIEMYLGNDLVDQMDPNLDRTDDLIRDSKGFNNWSFRRHKEESKKNKRKAPKG